jgi:glycosyltransferase involved in cell wall biosynthesis
MRRKLAIVSTHPIQYYSPVFRELAKSPHLEICVFYTWSQLAEGRMFDPGFKTEVSWDLPLLEGYPYRFVRNIAKRPGTHHFAGLRTPTLVQEIEAWKADAVLVYTWNSRSHLEALRRLKGRIPVLFRGDSTLLDERPWWRTHLRKRFLSWVYAHVDVAIAVGSNNRDYFAWCGLPPQRIAYAPHSVDTARFAADSSAHDSRAAEWREALRIGPDAVVFLFAGKLQSKKDPLLLLEAFSAMNDESHLVFVGSGELEAPLKERAAAQRNVHFMPFQNQSVMPAVYRLGDVYVLPSRGPEETWGLALNEAMASGRTAIASSKVGGARDLIHPDAGGWMFEAGNTRALLAVLRDAAALGRKRLQELGSAAQIHGEGWSTQASARAIAQAVIATWS